MISIVELLWNIVDECNDCVDEEVMCVKLIVVDVVGVNFYDM